MYVDDTHPHQTVERILAGKSEYQLLLLDILTFFCIGMDRIEPSLFECPHVNHKIVDGFMTEKEFVENG